MFTYINNYMEQSHSGEANSNSASQEISHRNGTQKFITMFTRTRPWTNLS